MLTRRKLVLGAALAALVPVAPALAAPDPLLADILYGVSDALTSSASRRRRGASRVLRTTTASPATKRRPGSEPTRIHLLGCTSDVRDSTPCVPSAKTLPPAAVRARILSRLRVRTAFFVFRLSFAPAPSAISRVPLFLP